MITAAQMRRRTRPFGNRPAALAELPRLTADHPGMEASEGNVRGVIDTLVKVIEAFDRAGVELIGEGAASRDGGRGFGSNSPVRHGAARRPIRCVVPRQRGGQLRGDR